MLRFTGVPGSTDPYVRIAIFDYKTVMLLGTANDWSRINKKVVDINAIDNGVHGQHTLHGHSMAWDLDVDGEFPDDLSDLANYLKMRLPPPYEIVLEATHVHIEWDTHR